MIKGKSAIHLARTYGERQRNFAGSIAILLARERIVVVNPCFSAPVRELDTGL